MAGAQQMRVVIVHNRYRSEQPSGEDRVVEQEQALLAGAGHLVTMFERLSDDIAGMSPLAKVAVPLRVPWNGAVRAELVARLRAERPDVVHVHSTFPLISPSVLAACAEVGIPVVATLHNYLQVCATGSLYRAGRQCTDCSRDRWFPAVRHGCYRSSRLATVPLALNLTFNRHRWWSGVTSFFCVSDAQRQALIQSGMPAERLVVKHNFVPDRTDRRDGVDGEHFLFLGRLSEEKGVRVLMAAWDRLSAGGGPCLPLVVAGGGPLADEVGQWASGRQDVRYVGLRSAGECAALTSRAAAVIVPSVWLEACPLTVLEAMAAGVPIVASGHGAMVELVDDGVTGLLHRPGDPVSLAQRLHDVADPERNRAMGEAARLRYEQAFTPAVGLERLVDGYHAAIAVAGDAAMR